MRTTIRSAPGLVAVALLAAGTVQAQEPSPYAGEESRAIKALSAEEVRQYLEGEGMGYALAAELNGVPGPRHVLDLADSLSLSSDQRARIQAVHDRMKADAMALGGEIVERERRLDDRFSRGSVDAGTLETAVMEIAALEGRLRSSHLSAHLETMPVLTPHQVASYGRLRGYGGGDHSAHGGAEHR